MSDEADFQQRMRKIEGLVQEIEAQADPRLRASSVELVSSLMELQGAGLAKIVEVLEQSGAAGAAAIERFVREPLVASLLLLHGLHPVDLETRVGQALEKVRPLLKSHGGNVELLGIEDDVVRLRLQGSCHGCPSSAQTLKNAIEEAIFEFAPDAAELHVEGAVPAQAPSPAGFFPLEQLV
jgi:Fe-S cluster biogenesis protein NfuA